MKFISVLAIGANKGYIKIESFTPIFQKKLSSQRGQAHFKIYDAWTYWESTKVIRIKFTPLNTSCTTMLTINRTGF